MPNWLENLLKSGAVWTALLALLNVIVKIALPNMSPELLTALNVLIVAILAAVGISVNQRLAARANRVSRM